jgi:prevent-host-death family protein
MLLLTRTFADPSPSPTSAYDHGMVTMVMSERSITATRLKAELLGVLDAVQATGDSVVVTKHGRPVARVVPIADQAPLAGSVRFLVDDEQLLAPVDVSWDAER